MLIIRWIVGVLGLAMLVGVVAEMVTTGSLSYALGARWGGPRWEVTGHETARSPAALIFAFGSFGLMGVGSVLFALRPRLFAHAAVLWGFVVVLVVSFVGLRLSE